MSLSATIAITVSGKGRMTLMGSPVKGKKEVYDCMRIRDTASSREALRRSTTGASVVSSQFLRFCFNQSWRYKTNGDEQDSR